jgi:hypothetical protein
MTAYEHALKDPSLDDPQVPQEDVVSVQMRLDWISSTLTQKMFQSLLKESDSLVASAIGLALVNYSQDNNKQIVQKLIEANVLRKVVKEYASNK